jgi:O-antigen ligase
MSAEQFSLRRPGAGLGLRAAGAGVGSRRARASALGMERDGFRVLLFLLIIVALSQIHHFLGFAAIRPAFLLAGASLVVALLNPARLNRRALIRSWPPKVMAGLGVLACISIPFSMSIGGSVSFMLESYGKTLVIGFLVVLAIRHVRDLYTLVWAVILSCAYLAFLAFLVVGVGKGQSLTYTSYDPNDIGLVLLVGLPLALALAQSTRSRAVRLISVFTVLGTGATIAISGSRGGFLGILAVGAALLVLLRGVSMGKRIAFVAITGGTLIIAAPPGYWNDMRSITDPDDYNRHSPTGRKAVWERGIGYMLSNPLTGIGIGNFPRAEGLISGPAVHRLQTGQGRVKWSAAHNSFLQPAAEMGIGGLMLFSALVFGGIGSMLRMRKRLPPWWARGDPQERFLYHMALYLPVSFVAFAVTGSFLSFAYVEPIYLLAAFVAGMYPSVEAKLRENRALGRGPTQTGRPHPSTRARPRVAGP